ncbi:MAG TPA: hypothetical protein V6C71_21530 [Coleofasciculaceae cyanobacterium]
MEHGEVSSPFPPHESATRRTDADALANSLGLANHARAYPLKNLAT